MTSTLTPCPNFIGGEWQLHAGAITPVFNPSTGDAIAECPAGGALALFEATVRSGFTPRRFAPDSPS